MEHFHCYQTKCYKITKHRGLKFEKEAPFHNKSSSHLVIPVIIWIKSQFSAAMGLNGNGIAPPFHPLEFGFSALVNTTTCAEYEEGESIDKKSDESEASSRLDDIKDFTNRTKVLKQRCKTIFHLAL